MQYMHSEDAHINKNNVKGQDFSTEIQYYVHYHNVETHKNLDQCLYNATSN